MSHDRCARSCYFALCLPSVFFLCPAPCGIPPPLSRSLRYSAVSVLLPAVFRCFLFCSRRYSAVLFSPIPCGIPLFLSCSRRYSAAFCPAPCGIPPFPILLPAVFRRLCPAPCGIPLFLSCSRRYSVAFSPALGGIPPFCSVLLPAVFRCFLSCSRRYSAVSVLLSPVFRRSVQSCSLRYSAVSCPVPRGIPPFCSVQLPAVFRRQSPFPFNPPQARRQSISLCGQDMVPVISYGRCLLVLTRWMNPTLPVQEYPYR